jgi:hypothetical protein
MECGEIFGPFSLPRYLRFVPGPKSSLLPSSSPITSLIESVCRGTTGHVAVIRITVSGLPLLDLLRAYDPISAGGQEFVLQHDRTELAARQSSSEIGPAGWRG